MRHRKVVAILVALGALTLLALALADLPTGSKGLAIVAALLAYGLLVHWVRSSLKGQEALLDALADGLWSLHDKDYSVSIAEPRDARLRRLVAGYNGLGSKLRSQRQDLYQRELLLDTVIQASPLAMVLTNATGTILYGNLAARELLSRGRRLEGLALAPLLETQPEALREALEDTRDQLFTTKFGDEAQVYHVSHRQFLLNGQPHRLRLLKQLTRELNAQEVAVWKKVIRVIAHEINNSVAPIASLAQSGHRLAQQPEPAQLQRVFAAIDDRMQHLSQFVEGYSRFAKLPKPRPAAVEWRPFLESLKAVSPFTIEDVLPSGQAWFDESQIEQVMINLLKNAIEASPADASVTVSLSFSPDVRDVLFDAVGDFAIIRVRDNGLGLTEEDKQRVFEPFFSKKSGGTGLGLYVTHSIIERHSGYIYVDSEYGVGTTFSVYLPVKQV
ncbi:MAG TPA: ATP-binding protein, partial [Steroidobacteraceae bacterium]|nr:ATP-binding protein [Steroidobacteraceae bacterium]